jgi:hypothetical protein
MGRKLPAHKEDSMLYSLLIGFTGSLTIALLSGCGTTPQEIRASAPIQQVSVSAPYERLAKCTLRRIDDEAKVQFSPMVQFRD